MAIVFARALRDGDVVVTGTNAVIPMSACRIAQLCGASHVVPVIGATGTLDPDTPVIPESGADQSFVSGRLTMGLGQGIADQVRGFADVIFLGGLQVDRKGRCNLTVVGAYGKPKLRGPGTIGLSMMARVRRTFLFFQSHDTRTFVDTVDFISGEGLQPDGGGVELIVTPLGVLGPTSTREAIDLKSIHPGVTFEEIQSHTGFPLNPDGIAVTPEPTTQELCALSRCQYGRQLASMRLEGV
jgi:glutaconate CoA-transferase, subunit B